MHVSSPTVEFADGDAVIMRWVTDADVGGFGLLHATHVRCEAGDCFAFLSASDRMVGDPAEIEAWIDLDGDDLAEVDVPFGAEDEDAVQPEPGEPFGSVPVDVRFRSVDVDLVIE